MLVFPDIVKSLEEVDMVLKAPRSRIIRVYPDGTSSDNHAYLHSFWKVTLINGDTYALDLTGAQYGWFEPAVSWNECIEHRCHELALSNRVGTARAFFRALDSCAHVRVAREFLPQYLALREWQKSVMYGVEERVVEYAWTNRLDAIGMLCLPPEEFRMAENVYLRGFVTSLHAAVTFADGIWYKRMLEVEASRRG